MISGAKARLTKAHARIGAALLLVGVLALSAEGDVSGGHSIGGDDAPQRRAGEIGFTYSAWLKDRRAYSGIDTIGEDSALSAGGEKPGSFWGDVAMRLGDNAVERARGSLLGIFPRGSELRDILLRYGNGEEFDMAQWREIRKRRLQESFRFAPVAFYADAEGALANAFSDTVVDRLAFVRRARIDFRTSLGGRSGNIGVDAAGAFRARDDDVIGWQLRAFGAQGGKGGNAGAYYRRVWGDALAGINIFADYEDDNTDGSFWRWSLGGEVKSRYGEISANHYFAVTDPRLLADGGYVYSRGGYDAEVAFRVPRAEWLRAHLSYYNFKGEFGDADDDGLRLGLDFEPGGGLVVGVEYDEGSGDFGGNIAFERNFGEPLRPAANAGTFDPRAHFFDLVRREYTQRITRTESSNPLEFYLTTSQISLMVDAPAVAAVVGGEGVAASPAVVGFTATVSPGPPFAVVGRADDVDISLAGLSRYILTLSDLTLETQSTTVNNAAAVFNQGFGIWVLTLRQSTRVAFDRRGILSVAFGSGVFERFRPEVISAVISEGATLDLAGTRIGWTTILNAGNVSVVFNVRAGAATVGVTTGGSVNIQNRATAILDIGGGTMRALSCDNLPSAGDISPNIRFACEAANASPVAIVGGGTDGRAVVPAELAAATLVATLINLGGAHTNYIFDVISGGDFIAMSEADSNGVVEISVLANPRVGDTEIVVGIRDIGGDDTNDTRRTVRVRVLEPLGLATTPTGRITITTQQSIGQELYIMRGIGGDGNYTFGLAGAVAGFEVSGSLVINNMTVNTAVLETLYLFVRDSFGTGATLTATIRVAHPPQLTLDLSDISPVVASADMFIQAGMADVSGGLEPKFTVEYDTTAGDISITINADSGLLEVRGRELIQLTITIVASDRHTRVNDVMDTRVISISPGLVLPLPAELASGGARVTTYGGFDISRVSLATFRGETRFTVQGYSLLNNYGGILALTPQSGGATRLDYVANSNAAAARMIAVSVEVRDNSPQGAPGSTPNMATATFNVTIVNPPALRLSSVNDTQNTGHRINVDRVVLLATVGGGFVRTDADYTFAVLPSDVGARLSAGSRGDESRFLYYRARTPATITVSISANDRHNNTPAATLPVTLTAIPLPVGFNTGNINTIIATAQGYLGIGNIQATGGLSPYSYTIGGSGAGDVEFRINANNGAVEVRARDIGLATMTIGASDAHEFSADSSTVIIITASPGLVLPLPAGYADLRLTTQDPRAVNVQLDDFVAGGGTNFTYRFDVPDPQVYQLVSFTQPIVNGRRVARLRLSPFFTNPALPVGELPLTIIAMGTNLRGLSDAATARFVANIVDPPPVVMSVVSLNMNVRPTTGLIPVARLRVTGGLMPPDFQTGFVPPAPGWRFSFSPLDADGALMWTLLRNGASEAESPLTVTALAFNTNNHTRRNTAFVTVSMTVVTELEIANTTITALGDRQIAPGGEPLLTLMAQGGTPPYVYSREMISTPNYLDLPAGGNGNILRLVGDVANNRTVDMQNNYRARIIVRDSATSPEVASMTANINFIRALESQITPLAITLTTRASLPNGGMRLATISVRGGFSPTGRAVAAQSNFPQANLAAATERAGEYTRHFVQLTQSPTADGGSRHIINFTDGRNNRVSSLLSVIVVHPSPLTLGFRSPPVLVHDDGSNAEHIGFITVGGGSKVPFLDADYTDASRPRILGATNDSGRDNGTLNIRAHSQFGFELRIGAARTTLIPRHTITIVYADINNHPNVRNATLIMSITIATDLGMDGGAVAVVNNRPVGNNEPLITLRAFGGMPGYTYSGNNAGNLSLDVSNTGEAVLHLVPVDFPFNAGTRNGVSAKTAPEEYEVMVVDNASPPASTTATVTVNYGAAPPITAVVLSSITAALQGLIAVRNAVVFSVSGGYTGALFVGGSGYNFPGGGVVGGLPRGSFNRDTNTTGPSFFAGVWSPIGPGFSGLVTVRTHIQDSHMAANAADENHFRFSLTLHIFPTIRAAFIPLSNGGAVEYDTGNNRRFVVGTLEYGGGEGNISHTFNDNTPNDSSLLLSASGGNTLVVYDTGANGKIPHTLIANIITDDAADITPAQTNAFTVTLLNPINARMSPPVLTVTANAINGASGANAAFIIPSGGQPPYTFRPGGADSSPFPNALQSAISHANNGSPTGTLRWSANTYNTTKGAGDAVDTFAITISDSSSPPRRITTEAVRITHVNTPLIFQRLPRAAAIIADRASVIYNINNSGGSGSGYSLTLITAAYTGGNQDALSVTVEADGDVIVSASRSGEARAIIGAADSRSNRATTSVTIDIFPPLTESHTNGDRLYLVTAAQGVGSNRTFSRITPSGGRGYEPGSGLFYHLQINKPADLGLTFIPNFLSGSRQFQAQIGINSTEETAGAYPVTLLLRDQPAFKPGNTYRQSIQITFTLAVVSAAFSAGFAPLAGLPITAGHVIGGSLLFDEDAGVGALGLPNARLSLVLGGITSNVLTVDIGHHNNSHVANLAVSVDAPPGFFRFTITAREFFDGIEYYTAEAVVTGSRFGFPAAAIAAFNTVAATADATLLVGAIRAVGGENVGGITYAIAGGNADTDVFIDSANGNISVQADTVGIFAITITANLPPPHNNRPIAVSITMSAGAGIVLGLPSHFGEGVSITTSPGGISQIRDEVFNLGRLTPQGGDNYALAFVNTNIPYLSINHANNDIFYTPLVDTPQGNPANATNITVSIILTGRNTSLNEQQSFTASFNLHINNPPPVSISVDGNINRRFFRHNSEAVRILTIGASGGYVPESGANSYRFTPAAGTRTGINIDTNSGILTYPNPVSGMVTLEARGRHSYNLQNRPAITVNLNPLTSLTVNFTNQIRLATMGGIFSRSVFEFSPITANTGEVVNNCIPFNAIGGNLASGLPPGFLRSPNIANGFCLQLSANIISPLNALIHAQVILPETGELAQTATATFSFAGNQPVPPFRATYTSVRANNNFVIDANGDEHNLGTIDLSGGYLVESENYTVSASFGRLSITETGGGNNNNQFAYLVSSAIPTVTIITIFAKDIHNATPDLAIIRTITAIGALGASWTSPPGTVTTYLPVGFSPHIPITVSVSGGLNPGTPVFHSSDINAINGLAFAGNGGFFYNFAIVREVTSGEVIVRVGDDRDGISVFATLSVFFVDPPTISLGFAGQPDFRPAPTEGGGGITIATLTMTGGLTYNRQSQQIPISVSVVGTHPSLSIVDMSIIVLNNASQETAHTITVQAKNLPFHPRITEPTLTIAVTVVDILRLRGGAITLTNGAPLSQGRPIAGTGEDVLTLTATGGETASPFYTYRILNVNPLYNIFGRGSGGPQRGVLRLTGAPPTGGGANILPLQTQPHTLSVEARENNANPPGLVTAVVTIHYAAPILRLNLGFSQTPNTIFLTLHRGTVGSITATEQQPGGTSTSGNSGFSNFPGFPANTNNPAFSGDTTPKLPQPPAHPKITTASTQPPKPTQPTKPPAVNSS